MVGSIQKWQCISAYATNKHHLLEHVPYTNCPPAGMLLQKFSLFLKTPHIFIISQVILLIKKYFHVTRLHEFLFTDFCRVLSTIRD